MNFILIRTNYLLLKVINQNLKISRFDPVLISFSFYLGMDRFESSKTPPPVSRYKWPPPLRFDAGQDRRSKIGTANPRTFDRRDRKVHSSSL